MMSMTYVERYDGKYGSLVVSAISAIVALSGCRDEDAPQPFSTSGYLCNFSSQKYFLT